MPKPARTTVPPHTGGCERESHPGRVELLRVRVRESQNSRNVGDRIVRRKGKRFRNDHILVPDTRIRIEIGPYLPAIVQVTVCVPSVPRIRQITEAAGTEDIRSIGPRETAVGCW